MKRLDKFLVEMSVASRSAIKDMAKKGRITVNGEVVKASDLKLDELSDVVAVDGQPGLSRRHSTKRQGLFSTSLTRERGMTFSPSADSTRTRRGCCS